MKLIVQIPALNERETISAVIADIPRSIPGVSRVEVLVIDDGCTDDTVAVALRAGADHIVRHTANKGLAHAYQTGVDTALRLGADLIVNTDADNQYPGAEIPNLVAPIIAGRADIVVGDRQVHSLEHFSPLKKALQHVGSSVVRWASETDVPDTVSGFRALSREAALRTFVTTDFSYTVEALIQAGKRRLTIVAVPVRTNHVDRPSRLHRGNWNFIKRQAAIIARTYATYEPLKVFSYIALAFFIPGALLLLRAAVIFIGRRAEVLAGDNLQALIVGMILVLMALITFLIGLLSDLVGGVRRVQQEILYRVRTMEVQDESWRRSTVARLDALDDAMLHEEREARGRT